MRFHSLAARGSPARIWSACPVAMLSVLYMLACPLLRSWLEGTPCCWTHFSERHFYTDDTSSDLLCSVNWEPSCPPPPSRPSLWSSPPFSPHSTLSPCSAGGIVLVINSGCSWVNATRQPLPNKISQCESRGFQHQDCLGSWLTCRFRVNGTRVGGRWGPGIGILTSSSDAPSRVRGIALGVRLP